MCLGMPMEVTEIEGNRGWVNAGGVRMRAAMDLVSDVQVGDYVIIHAGFAIQKLNKAEAHDTLELLAQICGEI